MKVSREQAAQNREREHRRRSPTIPGAGLQRDRGRGSREGAALHPRRFSTDTSPRRRQDRAGVCPGAARVRLRIGALQANRGRAMGCPRSPRSI